MTAPIRTALDLARILPATDAVATLDSMARLGLVTKTEMQQAARSLPPAPGRRDAITASDLLDPRTESVFESISRVLLALAGLPEPMPQLDIRTADGRWIGRVDFAWPRQRVILECDGYEYHRDRFAFERDRRRWSALTRVGWKVAVVTWSDVVSEPGYLVELVRDLLG